MPGDPERRVRTGHELYMRVTDIHVDRSTTPRQILFAFQGTDSTPGCIGIYTGQ